MASSAAKSGFGTLLKMGDGGGTEAFATVAEIRDINGPNVSRTTDDVTHQESPDGYMEKIALLRDGGQVTFNCNADYADTKNYVTLKGEFDSNDDLRNFQLQLPTAVGKTISFAGILTGISPVYPFNGAMRFDVTIDVSGKPVLAATA
jgi:hypothetical protein